MAMTPRMPPWLGPKGRYKARYRHPNGRSRSQTFDLKKDVVISLEAGR
jgi:hypothetical protein